LNLCAAAVDGAAMPGPAAHPSTGARRPRLAWPLKKIRRFAILGLLTACTGFPEAAAAAEPVIFPDRYSAGTIVIKHAERRLYLTTGPGTAIGYSIGVGKAGHEWYGEARVGGKYLAPAWTPPSVVRQDHPGVPALVPGGSPRNPLGAAAITLDRDEIAIHGTSQRMRRSVGTAASYGCFRMYNEDVLDLFRRVRIGTRVVAVP
jgi:lipoprotein-anchoring transpeptidase ErfK/SrfK